MYSKHKKDYENTIPMDLVVQQGDGCREKAIPECVDSFLEVPGAQGRRLNSQGENAVSLI